MIIDEFIRYKVIKLLEEGKIEDKELIETDNIGEVIEKLIILHIRNWMLEDEIGKLDKNNVPQYAELKRKTDICNKIKRPKLVEAINKLIENAVIKEKSLFEESVKHY
jgi:hypothetical protein